MYYKALLLFWGALISGTALAQWNPVNNVDYTWGPFKIYNISLATETGDYQANTRPIMLTLTYSKPVDGRDFAISVARSWKSLGISLPKQEEVIDKLRKTLPDLKPNDKLYYVAMPDHGYFILNDQVIDQIFTTEFNEAMLAIWLDPKVELSAKLTVKKQSGTDQAVHHSLAYSENAKEIAITPQKEPEIPNTAVEQPTETTPKTEETATQAVEKTENLTTNRESLVESKPIETQAIEESKEVIKSTEKQEDPEKVIFPIFDPTPTYYLPRG